MALVGFAQPVYEVSEGQNSVVEVRLNLAGGRELQRTVVVMVTSEDRSASSKLHASLANSLFLSFSPLFYYSSFLTYHLCLIASLGEMDYIAITSVLTFDPQSERSMFVDVSAQDDSVIEPTESFTVRLSSFEEGGSGVPTTMLSPATVFSPAEAVITIFDNDSKCSYNHFHYLISSFSVGQK